MNFRICGCFGSELPGFRSVGFLVNGTLLLDAGTAASVLTQQEQLDLLAVCVSHVHLDHVKELPFLVENRAGVASRPLVVCGTAAVVRSLKRDLFNDRLWPDFTRIPSRGAPALAYRVLPEGRFSRVGGLAVRPVRVNHTVAASAFVLREPGGSVLYTGDTGPAAELWRVGRALRDLRAVVAECSFASGMERLAIASGHLTPALLEHELGVLDRPDVPVYLYHMKPPYLAAIAAEAAGLSRPVEMLEQGRSYTFS